MLTELHLGGFQGFAEEMVADLAPITLIFGPNGSGKSSLLRGLRLLQQSVTSDSYSRESGRMIFEGDQVSLASFANVAHKHKASEHVSLGLKIDVASQNQDRSSPLTNVVKEIEIDWLISNPGIVSMITLVIKLHRDLGEVTLMFRRDEGILDLYLHKNAELLEYYAEALSSVRNDDSRVTANFDDFLELGPEGYLVSSNDSPWTEVLTSCGFVLKGIFPAIGPRRREGVSAKQQRLVAEVLFFVRQSVRRHLELAEYIGPLRTIADRIKFDAADQPIMHEDSRATRDEVRSNQVISEWLSRLTSGRYEYRAVNYLPTEVEFLGHLRSELIVDKLTNTTVTFGDVGVGLSQVLPILQVLNGANRRAKLSQAPILIEQPELHLHPKMQADLMDLFVESVAASPRIQVIAETHSEAMLLRLQKHLRRGTIRPEQVSVLYVDQIDQTNFVSNLPVLRSNDFEVSLPLSFSGLRLEDII